GGTDEGTQTITVKPVNDAPVADDDEYEVDEDGSITLNPLAGDTDLDGDTLSIVSINGVALTGEAQAIDTPNGTVTLDAAGVITFTPDENYNGPESFEYVITDGVAQATAEQRITVKPVNDAPTIKVDPSSSGVYEAGLDDGSKVGNTVTVISGTIVIGDVDGLDDITQLSIGDLSVPQQIGPNSSPSEQSPWLFETSYGVVSVTSLSEAGVLEYTYTLTDPHLHNDGTDIYVESISVSVSDGSATAEDVIEVSIHDDIPTGGFANAIGTALGGSQAVTGYIGDANLGSDQTDATFALTSFAGTYSYYDPFTQEIIELPLEGVTISLRDDNTYDLTFDYSYLDGRFIGEESVTQTYEVTGTLILDPEGGSYTVTLDQNAWYYPVYSTAMGSETQIDYDLNGSKSSSESVVQQYSSNFYGELTSTVATSKQTLEAVASEIDPNAPDLTYIKGDIFESPEIGYMNISNTSVGVDGDTVQPDEVLNFNFYTSNPRNDDGTVNSDAGVAYGSAIWITLATAPFSQTDTDILVNLLLEDSVTGEETTHLLIVNDESDFIFDPLSGGWKVFISPENYAQRDSNEMFITGLQIITSSENISGGGYLLSDGSPDVLTGEINGSDGQLDTTDADNIKIMQIEVQAAEKAPLDVQLEFTGTVTDADGDVSDEFSFIAEFDNRTPPIEGTDTDDQIQGSDSNDQIFALAGDDVIFGFAGDDDISGGDGKDTLVGGSGSDKLSGGAGQDSFKWGVADLDESIDTLTDFTVGVSGDLLDLSDLLDIPTGEGLEDYLNFALEGSDTHIQVDADRNGTVDLTIKLNGVDLKSNPDGGEYSDTQILQSLLESGNLQIEPQTN
ncbi:MAG TPA: Ig-like domain-containing protein, partial [Marinobacterium sp.]|nr:Ig-like domain-containing protein [Marinobacterium sp.]